MTAIVSMTFLIIPAACIGDIYAPVSYVWPQRRSYCIKVAYILQTQRGTAMGWFLSGTLVGPALGPFIGGIIITFTSWTVIFWMQTGLGLLATLAVLICLPETIHRKSSEDLEGLRPLQKTIAIARLINPWGVLRLFHYPSIIVIVSRYNDAPKSFNSNATVFEGVWLFLTCMEPILSSDTNPLRVGPTLPLNLTYTGRSVFPRARTWLLFRHILRWRVCGLRCQEVYYRARLPRP